MKIFVLASAVASYGKFFIFQMFETVENTSLET